MGHWIEKNTPVPEYEWVPGQTKGTKPDIKPIDMEPNIPKRQVIQLLSVITTLTDVIRAEYLD